MEYNNMETIDNFKSLMRIIAGEVKDTEAQIKFEADKDEMECIYRACELIEGWAEEARILLGKLMDEREDTEWAQF